MESRIQFGLDSYIVRHVVRIIHNNQTDTKIIYNVINIVTIVLDNAYTESLNVKCIRPNRINNNKSNTVYEQNAPNTTVNDATLDRLFLAQQSDIEIMNSNKPMIDKIHTIWNEYLNIGCNFLSADNFLIDAMPMVQIMTKDITIMEIATTLVDVYNSEDV